MKIKKIIVDKKPERCSDCYFLTQGYDNEHEEYYNYCYLNDLKVLDSETDEYLSKKCSDIFEIQ